MLHAGQVDPDAGRPAARGEGRDLPPIQLDHARHSGRFGGPAARRWYRKHPACSGPDNPHELGPELWLRRGPGFSHKLVHSLIQFLASNVLIADDPNVVEDVNG